ncbi:hypothetical protein PAXRUDRAFT_175053 [Paxillus rubicundulus Ve08.2h10]|uniref:Uncharacterized protein n=1 Tax=Paxillus rubicundulus Ve08.2h10 TaxID=930991 RepID=A0A0D0CHC2_9AGAM|nr:hypothetical protein PAXRUDRAFT_175053 [Paxillus rubicundulus Ve08.2h10]
MIDDFSQKANQYFAKDILVSQGHTDSHWHDVELGDEEILPLPSNIGANQCRDHSVGHLVDDELHLRQGLRINLGHWSFLYCTAVRQAKHSQQKKSRAWDTIHQVNMVLNMHTAIYHQCRKAMIALGGTPVLLQRYQELKQEHLQLKTIDIDPSVTGTRGENLPWFWTMNADLKAGNWMSQCELTHVPTSLADRRTTSSLGKIPLGKGECQPLHRRSIIIKYGDAMDGELLPTSQR